MTWATRVVKRPIYEYTGTNQHGDRYKIEGWKEFRIAKLSNDCSNTHEMRTLIVLSHQLDVPVCYDFDENIAYIEVVSAEIIK